jgi:IMP cyclohydrolase
MNNPNGPYPGRQLFLGLTARGKPSLAYLVTGRSPQSRERKAVSTEHGITIGPIGDEPYDWLRHYTAIKTDNEIGLAVVSNGIQTEAIFETYRLLYHTWSPPEAEYTGRIMDGANYEPDSLHTPRIAGVVTFPAGEEKPVYILSVVTDNPPAATFRIDPEPGTLAGIATYNGNLESPQAFNTKDKLPVVKFEGDAPEELAEFIYSISAATHQGDDIRVSAIGGLLAEDKHTWSLSIINRHG